MVTGNLHSMGIATGAESGDTKKPIAGAKQIQRAKLRAKEKAARAARAPAASKMENRVLRAAWMEEKNGQKNGPKSHNRRLQAWVFAPSMLLVAKRARVRSGDGSTWTRAPPSQPSRRISWASCGCQDPPENTTRRLLERKWRIRAKE